MRKDTYSLGYQLICAEAKRWVGMREEGGNNKGQFVEKVQDTVSPNDEDLPWCADFVYFCARAVQKQLKIMDRFATKREILISRSPSVMHMWKGVPHQNRILKHEALNLIKEGGDFNLTGLLAVWTRGKGLGHIGVVTGNFMRMNCPKPVFFSTVEGNSVDPSTGEQGVWEHSYDLRNSEKLLGFIEPFSA